MSKFTPSDESPGWLYRHMPPDTHSEIRVGLKHARRETESTNAHAHVLAWVREFNATYGYGVCPDRKFLNALIGVLFAAQHVSEHGDLDDLLARLEQGLRPALRAPELRRLFVRSEAEDRSEGISGVGAAEAATREPTAGA